MSKLKFVFQGSQKWHVRVAISHKELVNFFRYAHQIEAFFSPVHAQVSLFMGRFFHAELHSVCLFLFLKSESLMRKREKWARVLILGKTKLTSIQLVWLNGVDSSWFKILPQIGRAAGAGAGGLTFIAVGQVASYSVEPGTPTFANPNVVRSLKITDRSIEISWDACTHDFSFVS